MSAPDVWPPSPEYLAARDAMLAQAKLLSDHAQAIIERMEASLVREAIVLERIAKLLEPKP